MSKRRTGKSYEAEIKALYEHRDMLDSKITQLVRDLREMDQLVFQMSQACHPEQLRSAVQRAWTITEPRMRRESNRIADILIPEIEKVYTEPKPPILELKPTRKALR